MRFIVIDGLDGSGKDTHAELVVKRYREMGEEVILRSHPESDNIFGRRAKESLLKGGKVNHIRASIYYALDVLRSIKKYYRKDARGTFVVVRYLVGVAYLPYPLAWLLYRFFSAILPTSPYMFYLDLPPEEAMKRLELRDEKEMFETLEELTKVRGRALRLVKNWHIIDTQPPVEKSHEVIERLLNEMDEKS